MTETTTAAEPEFRDGLINNATFKLDWRGRIRVFLTGWVSVHTSTKTEHIIGRTETEAFDLHTRPVFPRRSRTQGEAEVGEPK